MKTARPGCGAGGAGDENGQGQAQSNTRSVAAQHLEAICEVRDWLEHSATVMERLIGQEQAVWKDEPGGAPELVLTMEQAKGLAEGIRTASENLNGAIAALLGREVQS